MITLLDLNDLATYNPLMDKLRGDPGEYRKLLRKCAEEFLKDKSQEQKILREIEVKNDIDKLRKECMRAELRSIKLEVKAIEILKWKGERIITCYVVLGSFFRSLLISGYTISRIPSFRNNSWSFPRTKSHAFSTSEYDNLDCKFLFIQSFKKSKI